MSAIRAAVLTIGLVSFMIGLVTGYGAIQDEGLSGNYTGALTATFAGAVLTLLALWWPRSK